MQNAMRSLPAPLAVFGKRRTWAELLFAVIGLPQGIAFFVFVVTTLTVSGGLAITFVGLPLLAVSNQVCRVIGNQTRRFTNALTGAQIAAPAPFRPDPGLFGWIGSCLRDGTAWRARVYMVLKLPLGIFTFVTAAVFWLYGLGGLTYAIWMPFTPCNGAEVHSCHRGINFGSHYPMDTPFRIAVVTVAGLVLMLAAPWVVRAAVTLDRLVAGVLLGPLRRDERVAQLEHSRAVAVDDAQTTLQRIERDLHDGTQARLVALAMNVGLAREKLAEGADPDEARRLLDTAHATAKQAIAEVRDLAKGIRPPVLDAGLDTALATLAANSAVPVALQTALGQRAAPAAETIAYFCVAELLTNVAKHSGAASAAVEARTSDSDLVVTVRDAGRGGARVGAGTGLAGLRDRVGTVDGTLTVSSPPGGPTVVTVRLPLELPQ